MTKTIKDKTIETLCLFAGIIIIFCIFFYIPLAALIGVIGVNNHTAYVIANWMMGIPIGVMLLAMFILALAMVVSLLVFLIKSFVDIWKS